MSKSLKVIQVIMKIMKVLSLIGFICSIIACVSCLVGGVVLTIFPFDDYEIDGIVLRDYVQSEADMTIEQMSIICFISAVITGGMVATTKLERNYYIKEVNDGTPFTLDGAKLLCKTAVISLCVSLGCIIIAAIIKTIFASYFVGTDFEFSLDIGWYLFLLFLSVVFKYGAEQSISKSDINY